MPDKIKFEAGETPPILEIVANNHSFYVPTEAMTDDELLKALIAHSLSMIEYHLSGDGEISENIISVGSELATMNNGLSSDTPVSGFDEIMRALWMIENHIADMAGNESQRPCFL